MPGPSMSGLPEVGPDGMLLPHPGLLSLDAELLDSREKVLKDYPDLQDFTDEDFAPAQKKGASVAVSTRPSLSYWQDAWIRLKQNRQALVSLGVIAVLILFTLLGPLVWRLDPSAQNMSRTSESPSFGTEAVVLGVQDLWEVPTLSVAPPVPEGISGSTLPAVAQLKVAGIPSIRGVRLTWDAVPGAESYVVYRAEGSSVSLGNLGVPVGETESALQLGFEDVLGVEPKKYTYSVVAKNIDESIERSSIEVAVPAGIAQEEAELLGIRAEPGAQVTLPSHPLGTDNLGRDVLARVMQGARVSLFIGFFAPLLWVLLGVIVGGIAGFAGGRVDHVLMRFTDFVLALPFLLFMILFKIAFGTQAGESGISAMLVSMVLLSWTAPARLVRGQVLQLRESEFVHAATLLGARPKYILLRHLLPNTLGVILVSLTFAIPSAIFTEAFLSFIGMGVVPPTPSWGSMCNDGIQTFLNHPHEFLAPALLISLTVLAFNLLGDGLRDALDPKLRGKS